MTGRNVIDPDVGITDNTTISNISVYINDFDTSINATAGTVPTDTENDSFNYTLAFSTSMSADYLKSIFSFVRDASNNTLKLTAATSIDFTDASMTQFSVVNSTFTGSGTLNNNIPYFSLAANAPGIGTLVLSDDYLGYLAATLLGSQALVGAFGNVKDIVTSISDTVADYGVRAKINNVLANLGSIDIDTLTGAPLTSTPQSALLNIFTSIFNYSRERIDYVTVADGVTGQLLYPGDTLIMKFTVITPTIDSSIVRTTNDANFDFTPPTTVEDRVYKIIINIV